jgi:hypothetical protein
MSSIYTNDQTGTNDNLEQNEIVSRAAAYINTLRIPKKLRISWKKKLRTHYPFSLIGVILTLVSNVTHVTLALDTEVVQDQRIDFLCACFGIRPTKAHNLAYIQRIGTLSFVKSLTIRGPAPVAVTGLDLFPGIQDLHLRLELRPSRHVGLTPAIDSFRNVSRLRLGESSTINLVCARNVNRPTRRPACAQDDPYDPCRPSTLFRIASRRL